jgi:hypothetical protein
MQSLRPFHFLLPLFPCFAAAAGAQTTFTAPLGHDAKEGASAVSFNSPFTTVESRYQYCYGGLRGAPRNGLKAVALRRDGDAPTSPEYEARSLTLAVKLAHANYATLTTTFASNYLTPAVTVFNAKTVNLPSHANQPGTPPAAWSVSVPFDALFSYNGSNDLLLELVVTDGSSIKGYSLDCVDARGLGHGAVTYLDPNGKCTTANGPYEMYAFAPTTSVANLANVRVYGAGAPSSTPSALLVGLSDPNLGGVFCAPLRSSLELTVPLLSSATGGFGSVGAPLSYSFPIGAPLSLYLQFASLTPAPNTVHLSDAVRVDLVLGNDGVLVRQLANRFDDLATTGTLTNLFVPVVQFQQ